MIYYVVFLSNASDGLSSNLILDLKTWEFRNDVLKSNSAEELNFVNIERPKVLYNAKTKKFVLWAHKENGRDYVEARVAVATSDTVDGDYTYLGSFNPLGYESRDMTVFQDTDGSAYLISAAAVNYDLNIYKLSDDYTKIDRLVTVGDLVDLVFFKRTLTAA